SFYTLSLHDALPILRVFAEKWFFNYFNFMPFLIEIFYLTFSIFIKFCNINDFQIFTKYVFKELFKIRWECSSYYKNFPFEFMNKDRKSTRLNSSHVK